MVMSIVGMAIVFTAFIVLGNKEEWLAQRHGSVIDVELWTSRSRFDP